VPSSSSSRMVRGASPSRRVPTSVIPGGPGRCRRQFTDGGRPMDQMTDLREHLLYLLRGGAAHLDFDKAVADLPPQLRGVRPAGLPHSPWRLLEHLRIAQWDILEFCRNPRHVSPPFPDGYWPQGD